MNRNAFDARGRRVLTTVALLALATTLTPLFAKQFGFRNSAQLTVLHLADVYQIAPVDGGKSGGMARVAALRQALMANRKNVMVTLGGDFLSPSVASSVFKGQQAVETLQVMGLDITTIGNHEFDFGADVLRKTIQESAFTWVVSNVIDDQDGEPLGGASEYLVREFNGLKVGFFGLCISNDEISFNNRRGVTFLDPFETAERMIEVLENESVDVIVALTHLDFSDDVELAGRFPRINLILGAHDHYPITTHVNRTLISKPGSDARFASILDISRQSVDSPVEIDFQLVPVTAELGEEEETAAVVARWQARLEEEMNTIIGSTAAPLDGVTENVRSRETNLGNLMADAMRRDTGADIALLNSGSVRGDRIYSAGEISRRDIITMHPFGGTICEVEISGALVLEALNHGVSRLGDKSGQFPQVSGIRFEIDPSKPVGERVSNVFVGREPLEPERLYRVALVDYMLGGGNGYSMFADARVIIGPEQGSMLISALESLIKEMDQQTDQADQQIEERIRFIGKPLSSVRRPAVFPQLQLADPSYALHQAAASF